jgi:hypothetical protein
MKFCRYMLEMRWRVTSFEGWVNSPKQVGQLVRIGWVNNLERGGSAESESGTQDATLTVLGANRLSFKLAGVEEKNAKFPSVFAIVGELTEDQKSGLKTIGWLVPK